MPGLTMRGLAQLLPYIPAVICFAHPQLPHWLLARLNLSSLETTLEDSLDRRHCFFFAQVMTWKNPSRLCR